MADTARDDVAVGGGLVRPQQDLLRLSVQLASRRDGGRLRTEGQQRPVGRLLPALLLVLQRDSMW